MTVGLTECATTTLAAAANRRGLLGAAPLALAAALGLGAEAEAKKKRKKHKNKKKRTRNVGRGAPPPLDLCPVRACCQCVSAGTPVGCRILPLAPPAELDAACAAFCGDASVHAAFDETALEPGATSFGCAAIDACVELRCPLL